MEVSDLALGANGRFSQMHHATWRIVPDNYHLPYITQTRLAWPPLLASVVDYTTDIVLSALQTTLSSLQILDLRRTSNMASTTPNSIRLEVPRLRIASDLTEMTRHLAAAAAQGSLLQNWGAVVTNIFSAATAVRVQHEVATLAWQLLLTGIGEALTDLANDQPLTLINDNDVVAIQNRVAKKATNLVIPTNFLVSPWSLSPVQLAKTTLLQWISPPAGTPPQQNLLQLGRRFDSALVLGLHRAIRRDEVRYRPFLALSYDPTKTAWQELEDWNLYRAELISQFRSDPVFDESFALDQIFVPLNAWHATDHVDNDEAEKHFLRTVVSFQDDTLAWLRGERHSGRLRIVSGGPGSGKSSAIKALAASLSESGNDSKDIDVLLFPLQRFQWRVGIIESVADTLMTYANSMRHNPLDPTYLRARTRPLLLIFDRLDELAASAEVGEAISATFLRELNTTLRLWESNPVWVMVTGRDAIFGHAEGPTMNLPGERFHLLPYFVPDHHQRTPHGYYHDPESLLLVDNREAAFYMFSRARGDNESTLPYAYQNNSLFDITTQPLLNYFFLTSELGDIADGNIARIYSHLFRRLHARNRNVRNRLEDAGKPGAGLSQEQFDRIFEVMAVAAWRTGGARAAGWAEVLVEAKREDTYLGRGGDTLLDIFESHMVERGGQKPFRLAAAFFMRNEQASGVEFTHKSFGDYLYARRLVKALRAMAEGVMVDVAMEKEMIDRWGALTADQGITQEVERFMMFEVLATVEGSGMDKWHEALPPHRRKSLSRRLARRRRYYAKRVGKTYESNGGSTICRLEIVGGGGRRKVPLAVGASWGRPPSSGAFATGKCPSGGTDMERFRVTFGRRGF